MSDRFVWRNQYSRQLIGDGRCEPTGVDRFRRARIPSGLQSRLDDDYPNKTERSKGLEDASFAADHSADSA